jgi:hypothetical protein
MIDTSQGAAISGVLGGIIGNVLCSSGGGGATQHGGERLAKEIFRSPGLVGGAASNVLCSKGGGPVSEIISGRTNKQMMLRMQLKDKQGNSSRQP